MNTPRTQPDITGAGWIMFGGVFLVALLVVLVALQEHTEQLILGWLYFPLRTIPRMTVDWPTVLLGTLCSLLFVVGFHRTARWFVRTTNRSIRWSWRSSVVTSALMFVLFASGTSLVGATHQLVWLISDRHDPTSDAVATSDLGPVAQARDAARRTITRYRLKEFGYAFHNFHEVYQSFPPGGMMNEDGELLHGWAVFLGGYTNYFPRDLDYRLPWRVPPNDRVYKCQMPDFLNPSQPGPTFDAQGYGLCHWAGNIHVLPVISVKTDPGAPRNLTDLIKQSGQAISLDQITDGTANTILLGTVAERFKPWGHPANVRDPALGINRTPDGFGGPPGWQGAMFLMCDGSVRFLDEKTDLKIMQALATPASGDPIPREFELKYLR
ncbi:MAG: DUF1559 domain-containing protein [Planctomycetes bacterium]|nr:DUF1559 domain-containing protein [Planctomycetota bacterium]